MGPDFFVGYRFSAREYIPGGIDLPEAIQMAKAIQEAGADYLSVSHGCYGSLTRIFPRGEGSMSEDAAAIQKNVSIPVMAPNFQDPGKAAEAIADGSIALIALSRALLADPLWARKVKEGRPEDHSELYSLLSVRSSGHYRLLSRSLPGESRPRV